VVLLVRYGELSLKSPYVRRQLEDRLAANVHEMFAAGGVECLVKFERGRLFVHADDEGAALRLLRSVFGIVSVSPAKESSSDLGTLTSHVVVLARDSLHGGMSFAIRARRSGEHPYTSRELATVLGKAVQDAIPGLAVDLDSPDCELHVEVRGPRAYVFQVIVEGAGGLPLGSQGKAFALVEDDAGLVAAWLMMRRGCRLRVAGGSELARALRRWDPKLEVIDVRTEAQLLELASQKGMPLVLATEGADGEAAGGRPFVLRPLSGLSSADLERLAAAVRSM